MNIVPTPVSPIAPKSLPVPTIDHARVRFESIERQHDLAPELSCFRPGNELSSIRFIAHAHSVHVSRWLILLSHTQATVEVDTVNPLPAFSSGFLSARPLLPAWLKVPMTLRYLLGGLALRLLPFRSSTQLVMAHSASGNGLTAWLSGCRYLIVTYGSEIFGANERGFAYRWLLKKILQGAERIADCSPECTRILREDFQIPADRIHSFHLGYDEKTFRPLDRFRRMELRRDRQLPVDEPIWVVNRRTHPHYRTQEVAEGFLKYCQNAGRGKLILLCGDQDPGYTQSVCDLITAHDYGERVLTIRQMLTAAEFAAWMQLSDYSISVPRTDNFSIAILESMGCGTVPILSNLDGYGELNACESVRWMTDFTPDSFSAMFAETAESWRETHETDRKNCLRFVQDGFSSAKAIRDIAAFYLGTPPQVVSFTKKAA